MALIHWHKALTLNERIVAFKKQGKNHSEGEIDHDMGAFLLDEWKTHPELSKHETLFDELLVDLGVDETEFQTVLGLNELFYERAYPELPEWVRIFNTYWAQPYCTETETFILNDLTHYNLTPFLPFAKPFIHYINTLLSEKLTHKTYNFISSQHIRRILFQQIIPQLISKYNRCLILEMYIEKESGVLQGETSEERFKVFIQKLRDDDYCLNLWNEYSVLVRQFTGIIQQQVNAFSLILERLETDQSILQKQFDITDFQIQYLHFGSGELHNQGQSVGIVQFKNGQKLVYKPRSLSVDVHFNLLLDWFKSKDATLNFKQINILHHEQYGWAEFIRHQPVEKVEDFSHYYQQFGALTCLLYALEATDFHHENLIASGKYPVLIDLESLFHPRISLVDQEENPLHFIEGQAFSHSVLRVGILPMPMYDEELGTVYDVSAMGAIEKQQVPKRALVWEGIGTDEMRVSKKWILHETEQNQPTIEGDMLQNFNIRAYRADVLKGFEQVYHIIQNHKCEFLTQLETFKCDTIRVILRATEVYSLLLRESFHPDCLRDQLDRDLLFQLLRIETLGRKNLKHSLTFECNDLNINNIPFFYTYANTPHIYHEDIELADYLPKSSLEATKHHIDCFSDTDLALQCWYIDVTFKAILDVEHEPKSKWHKIELKQIRKWNDIQNKALILAEQAGKQLLKLAYKHNNQLTWMGITSNNDVYWKILPVDMNLYGGLSGLQIFFHHLGIFTKDKTYHNVAEQISQQIGDKTKHIHSTKMIGAFEGITGLLYAHSLTQPQSQISQNHVTEHFLNILENSNEEDERLDIIGGSAGTITVLASLLPYCSDRKADITNLMVRFADFLLDKSTMDEHGNIYWEATPLAGMAHGAAGFALAFAHIYQITHQTKYLEAIQKVIRYENTLFSESAQNWKDLRGTILGHDNQFTTGWCHGAPGIGLARIATQKIIASDQWQRDINTAIETTIQRGFGHNHSLCHGDLGNLESVRAGLGIQDKTYQALVSQIVASIEQYGFKCGIRGNAKVPGLMNGLAGIGLGLLRIIDPNAIPNVLTLST